MDASPASAALAFLAFAVLVAGCYSWLVAAAKAAITWKRFPEPLAKSLESALVGAGLSPRLPLVAWSPRRAVPWAFIDLLALLGILIIVSEVRRSAGIFTAEKISDQIPARQWKMVIDNMALPLVIAAIGVAVIAIRTGAGLRDFGWSWSKRWTDLRLGLIGFVMIAPPVYALQGALVFFWKESKHPLMEMFKESPDAGLFGLLIVSAAIVAPLFEELIFRVVLQGFLEKVFSFRGEARELLIGRARDLAFVHIGLPAAEVAAGADATPLQPELRGLAAWLPIAISSAVFAMLHYSHGPDWIPLFFLAAGMGYLYQRTHRLLPSLVVHATLNGLSLWGLWVQVQEAGAGG